ncbi:MAG: nitroreductase family protein [Actinomycetota bacterium]|nr:nitroreductase family protein [Actinomycetota bacterium]
MDRASIDLVLSTTRAVRRRLDLDRPVDPAIIEECLELASFAPTGGNGQAWRWIVVTEPGKRAAIASVYRRFGTDYLSAGLASAPSGSPEHRVFSSALHLADVLDRVPVLVIPCYEGEPGVTNAEAAGFYGSILPAAWSLLLALRSRGLGSAWTTLHLEGEQEVAELLGMPFGFTQVALFPVAHTIGAEFGPPKRRPIGELTYWDQWGVSRRRQEPG